MRANARFIPQLNIGMWIQTGCSPSALPSILFYGNVFRMKICRSFLCSFVLNIESACVDCMRRAVSVRSLSMRRIRIRYFTSDHLTWCEIVCCGHREWCRIDEKTNDSRISIALLRFRWNSSSHDRQYQERTNTRQWRQQKCRMQLGNRFCAHTHADGCYAKYQT